MLLIPYLLPYPYPLNLYLLPTCPAAPTCPLPPLCRALKTKGNTPKYGLIFHSSFIGRAKQRNKGRISRYLANKCSIASRIDCFMDVTTPTFGEAAVGGVTTPTFGEAAVGGGPCRVQPGLAFPCPALCPAQAFSALPPPASSSPP